MFKQSEQHLDTYYAHSCRDQLREYAPLAGAQRYDVAVVGAGFSGLHTALRLAQAGKRVVLLEASRLAARSWQRLRRPTDLQRALYGLAQTDQWTALDTLLAEPAARNTRWRLRPPPCCARTRATRCSTKCLACEPLSPLVKRKPELGQSLPVTKRLQPLVLFTPTSNMGSSEQKLSAGTNLWKQARFRMHVIEAGYEPRVRITSCRMVMS